MVRGYKLRSGDIETCLPLLDTLTVIAVSFNDETVGEKANALLIGKDGSVG